MGERDILVFCIKSIRIRRDDDLVGALQPYSFKSSKNTLINFHEIKISKIPDAQTFSPAMEATANPL